MSIDRHSHIWSYRKNSATGAHRVKRKLESCILADGRRLEVVAPVCLVSIGKWRGFEAETNDGFRWARIVGGKVFTQKERPC